MVTRKRGNIRWGKDNLAWNRTELPRKITPSDIDAVWEVNGQFLVYEHKTGNAAIQTGQRNMYAAMLRTGYFTFLEGRSERVEFCTCRTCGTPHPTRDIDVPGDIIKYREWNLDSDRRPAEGEWIDGETLPEYIHEWFGQVDS